MGRYYQGLVFILDGLGDRPCPPLGQKTPLEAAHTPNLDKLATHGQTGLMYPLLPGLPVDTHTGVGMLFGMPPKQATALNRGPIEAAGIDLELQPGDVLLRCNFATLEKHPNGFRILDRRAGRIAQGVEQLCESLRDIEVAEHITASVFPATQHRAVLRLRGKGLSAQISDTDPGGKGEPLDVLPCTPKPLTHSTAHSTTQSTAHSTTQSEAAAQNTAAALNRLLQIAHTVLENHAVNQDRRQRQLPVANGLITRSAGIYQAPENLLAQLGLKVAVVAGESTILGLAKLCGFSVFSDAAFTSLPDTDIALKLSTARRALHDHDLVFVHLKATDTTAHDRQPRLKAEFIARFDHQLGVFNPLGTLGPLGQPSNWVVGLCADHSTDSIRGEHNGDAVPILLYNPEGRRDTVKQFDETACTLGGLPHLTAAGFLFSVLDAMGAIANYKLGDIDYLRFC